MQRWKSPQSYLPQWIGSVYELEREDDGSWLYSEHRTKELFQQPFVRTQPATTTVRTAKNFDLPPPPPHPPHSPPLSGGDSHMNHRRMLEVSLWRINSDFRLLLELCGGKSYFFPIQS